MHSSRKVAVSPSSRRHIRTIVGTKVHSNWLFCFQEASLVTFLIVTLQISLDGDVGVPRLKA